MATTRTNNKNQKSTNKTKKQKGNKMKTKQKAINTNNGELGTVRKPREAQNFLSCRGVCTASN